MTIMSKPLQDLMRFGHEVHTIFTPISEDYVMGESFFLTALDALAAKLSFKSKLKVLV